MEQGSVVEALSGCVVDVDVTPELLFREHYIRLTRTAMLLADDHRLAEEVVQDAFAELVARWERIDANRAVAYLYRSVANRGRSILRRRRTARALVDDRPPPEPGADDEVIRRERDGQIRRAVSRLPRRQRQVIVLRFYSDLSVAEVARVLRISAAAVAMATHHAVKTLQQQREEWSS